MDLKKKTNGCKAEDLAHAKESLDDYQQQAGLPLTVFCQIQKNFAFGNRPETLLSSLLTASVELLRRNKSETFPVNFPET